MTDESIAKIYNGLELFRKYFREFIVLEIKKYYVGGWEKDFESALYVHGDNSKQYNWRKAIRRNHNKKPIIELIDYQYLELFTERRSIELSKTIGKENASHLPTWLHDISLVRNGFSHMNLPDISETQIELAWLRMDTIATVLNYASLRQELKEIRNRPLSREEIDIALKQISHDNKNIKNASKTVIRFQYLIVGLIGILMVLVILVMNKIIKVPIPIIYQHNELKYREPKIERHEAKTNASPNRITAPELNTKSDNNHVTTSQLNSQHSETSFKSGRPLNSNEQYNTPQIAEKECISNNTGDYCFTNTTAFRVSVRIESSNEFVDPKITIDPGGSSCFYNLKAENCKFHIYDSRETAISGPAYQGSEGYILVEKCSSKTFTIK
jgi:hypothetical protein